MVLLRHSIINKTKVDKVKGLLSWVHVKRNYFNNKKGALKNFGTEIPGSLENTNSFSMGTGKKTKAISRCYLN